MPRLTQSFVNTTGSPIFINLELSTARFRLEPGKELLLEYDSNDTQNPRGSPLRIEFITSGDAMEVVVWTGEDSMFNLDGP